MGGFGTSAGVGIELATGLPSPILNPEFDFDPARYYNPGNLRASNDTQYVGIAASGNILFVLPQFFSSAGVITDLRSWIGNTASTLKQLIFSDSLVLNAHTPGSLIFSQQFVTAGFHTTVDSTPNVSVNAGQWVWFGMIGLTDGAFNGGALALGDNKSCLPVLGTNLPTNTTGSPAALTYIGYKNAFTYGNPLTVYPTPLTPMFQNNAGFPISAFKFRRS